MEKIMSDKLGDILLRLGYVKKDDINQALDMQNVQDDKKKLGEILRGFSLKEDQLTHALSIQNNGYQMDTTLAIVSKILKQRLHQTDIKQMLNNLSLIGHDKFIEKISEILNKTAAFFEISHKLSETMSLDSILKKVVEITNEAMNSDRGTIFLNDSETGDLYSRIAQGELIKEIRFPNHIGIAGAVFSTGTAIIIDDAYADPRFNQEVDKATGYRTENILCAAIKTRSNEIIGAIQLLNKKDGRFTSDDLTLLEAITSQAAAALLNVQLYEQVRKAREEEAKLLEVTTAISTELNLEPLLFRIMEATTGILDADRSTLFMHDDRTNELWSLVAQGTESSEIRFPGNMGIAGSVFTNCEVVNIPDAYKDNRFNPEFDRKTGFKTRSILCIPVINKSGVAIGAIQVLNKRGGPFTVYDEKRLSAFAAQASIAIENAKLFDEVLNMKNYNESILESMSNGVITLDAYKTVVKCNQAAEKILNKKSELFVEKSVETLFFEKNSWINDSIERVIKTSNQDINMDTDYYIDEEHSISINLTSVPLKNIKQEIIGYMLIFEDITTEKRLKGTMARYMTKEVAEKLLEGGENLLGGQIKQASVLFSDIRSFTTISEKLGAKETVSMLNKYFTCMVDVIFQYEGILDKYIGDAILAVFGTPFSTDRDADNSVNAAIDMMTGLRELNRNLDEKISIGIGINSEEILVGNIGSLKRMDYTVIGDGVNLASRLESANKYFSSSILISEFTLKQLKDEYKCRKIDNIKVKGKNKPVGVYEILDYHDEESFPHMNDVLENYHSGLSFYRDKNWKKALECFNIAKSLNPQDGATNVYIDRCIHFIITPPPEEWDGCWVMKDK